MSRRIPIFEFVVSVAMATSAFAGSTGQAALHMPQGSAAGTPNGDYVSDAGGLVTLYRYFIEVPPGLGRLVVALFDADVGRGGNGEDDAGRDRDRGGGWSTQADYTLIRPDGSTAASLLNCSNGTCTDNAWQTLLDSTSAANTAAGHWELRVDMDGGNDINALGIRAHDGTSGAGGTELNVYAESMISLGVNPDPGANARAYTMYPWITSGCTCSQNDFDRDSNNGNIGSVTYTSRSGGFTQTFASATLSANDVWNHDNLTRWGDDDESDDYGIWTFSPTITTYDTGATNGNYETTYVGSYLAPASDPTVNPIVSGGNPATFRIYLPTDAAVAPVKPYLEQFLTHNLFFPGTNPPTVGAQSVFTVTLRFVNPTAYSITFNASNLIIASVPGGGVTYGGNPTMSQGSITAPAIGGTGNVSWNPGTVAAGATAILAYDVRVTPPSAARVLVTATPASGNGTRAQFIDETANATQARARYLMGGLCELAVQAGLATEVLLSKFNLDVRGGGTNLEFATASEAGTVGFNVYRRDGSRVNATLIPASLKPNGGTYQLFDRNNVDPNAAYMVEEVTASGRTHRYGPLNHLEGIDRDEKQKRSLARRMQAQAEPAWSVASNADDKLVAAMVGVRQTGVVRVTSEALANALGTNTKTIEKALQKASVSVTSNRTPVAWQSDAQNLYFFGEKSTSLYSNDRVYRIELADGVRMQNVNVSGATAPVSSFQATQEIENDLFAATVLPLDPAGDYWFWEALISGDPSWGIKTFNIDVPALASARGAALSVRLQGAFKETTHKAKITLNGVPIGEATWRSFDASTTTINLPVGVLRDGANEIGVEGVLEDGAPIDIFYVDGFTLQYQKYARPQSGQLEARAGGTFSAGPFTTAPYVLDITNRTRPQILVGASFNGGTTSLVVPSRTKDLFLAESFVTPSFIRGSTESKAKLQRADWVVIAPRSFRAAAESLASLRSRDGLVTMVVDLERVYDEFAGGNSTPFAIKSFITSTRSWSKAPKYFVLAGTGSVDYRGIEVAPGPMPPLMTSTPDGLFASDSLYADRNGDRLPDVAIGRIPVTTAAELAAYVAKLDRNGRVNPSQSPIVFSADANDQGVDFRGASEIAEAPLASRPAKRVYVDDLGAVDSRTQFINAWRSGTPLVSWVGHGGLDQISNAGLLTSYDAGDLASTGRLPVFIAMTCTINRFENGYVDPLGTSLTKEDGAGAVAVWSASGLSQSTQANEIQRTFMRLAAEKPNARVGDLIVEALAHFANDTSSIYLLLGDPAIKLDLPAEVNPEGGTPSPPGE